MCIRDRVTVAVLANRRTDRRDSSMKSARERMDMHAAYREVGSYRAAAEICGTTDKTIKRAVEKARVAETTKADGVAVAHNYDPVTDVIAAVSYTHLRAHET